MGLVGSSWTHVPILNTDDARRQARRSLPRILYDYIEGGADDEISAQANEQSFRALQLRPHLGIEVTEPSLDVEVLGAHLSLPVMLAPCAFLQLMHHEGAVGAARAAAAAGTIAVLSRIALCAPEVVAAHSSGIQWFQINSNGGRARVRCLMDRAEAAGFTGLVVTLDGQPPGHHERVLRHHSKWPPSLTPAFLAWLGAQLALRTRWTVRTMPSAARSMRSQAFGRERGRNIDIDLKAWPGFTWSDLKWIRANWNGVVIAKGILSASDAVASRDAGADAVVVSNHGGRQLDGVPAPLEVLSEIATSVGDSVDVLLDGGIRRGTDVIKALALGAKAVFVGRPFVYGLANAGQSGVENIIDIFRTEISQGLKLMGCRSVSELDSAWVRPCLGKNA